MNKVFIGVGHGGIDSGAVANGMMEKDANLATALAMKAELERHGVSVGISRTTDEDVGLEREIQRCRAFAPDAAVEVHNNAGGGQGFEVLCQTGRHGAQSKRLGPALKSISWPMARDPGAAKSDSPAAAVIITVGCEIWMSRLSCAKGRFWIIRRM